MTAISDAAREALLAAARGDRVSVVANDALIAAGREGMIALLARAAVAPSRELQLQSIAVEAHAVRLVRELARIAAAFEEARIPMLAWKGAVGSQQLYGDPWLRSFTDLDVIVAPRDAGRGEALLARLGFAEMEPLTRAQRATHRRFDGASLFAHSTTETLVDFHWRLSNPQFPLRLSFDEAWDRRARVRVGDCEVASFGDVDLVVITCSHAAKHLWHRLEFLAQIAALAKRDLDWRAVDDLALRSGGARQTGLSFLLARDFLGVTPPPLTSSIARAEPHRDAIRALVAANLFADGERKHDATGRDLFLLLDSRRDALRSLALGTFVPTYSDWQNSGLPEPLQWLRRPLKLLWQRMPGRKS